MEDSGRRFPILYLLLVTLAAIALLIAAISMGSGSSPELDTRPFDSFAYVKKSEKPCPPHSSYGKTKKKEKCKKDDDDDTDDDDTDDDKNKRGGRGDDTD